MEMPRILIAAGGTAGHVVPALAVADELRASGASVSFVGAGGRAEARLVPAAGYEIALLDLAGIDRRHPASAARAIAKALGAMPAVRRLIRASEPNAVLAGGGYVAGAVGPVAAAMHVPLVLSEAYSHFGLANRLLAPYAQRVCLAFPIAGREGGRYLVTGRPVPRGVVEADREAARARLEIAAHQRCLLVFGGSLGARSINECAFAAFAADPLGDVVIVHVSGERDHPALAARLVELGNPSHYRLFEYFDTLADPLAACDLVLARSGGSVFEVAAAGRPAILVPYPHATADHQADNARWMERAGAAVVVGDSELAASRLRELVGQLLEDEQRLAGMGAAARSIARPDAAARVATELLRAAGTA